MNDSEVAPFAANSPVKFPLSDDFKEASLRIAEAEFGDKTFLLLIILTVVWSSWNKDDYKNNDKSSETDPSKNPARMILASSLGITFINVKSLLF